MVAPPISLWFPLFPWVTGSSSFETEGALSVDCTPTIKSILLEYVALNERGVNCLKGVLEKILS